MYSIFFIKFSHLIIYDKLFQIFQFKNKRRRYNEKKKKILKGIKRSEKLKIAAKGVFKPDVSARKIL